MKLFNDDVVRQNVSYYVKHRIQKFMMMVTFSSFLLDFSVKWQNMIDEKSNSLLNRQNYLEVSNCEPLLLAR